MPVDASAEPAPEPDIIVRIDGAVWTIVLNRPARRNAINATLQRELVAALAAFDSDPDARSAVLTGADPAFCSGMDLNELGAGRLGHSAETNFADAMRALTKPVIGAINGPAVAGGLELALACDFLLASDRAWFADTHADVNVVPGGGLTVRLAQAVGVRRARQMSFTGEYVGAARALQDGLVTEVVPHDELLPRARVVAAAIASRSEWIVRELRLAYNRALNLLADDALDAETARSRQVGIPNQHIHDVAGPLIGRGAARIAGPDIVR